MALKFLNNGVFSGDVTLTQTSGNNTLTIDSSGGGNPVIYLKDPTRTWGQFISNGDLFFKDETSNITSLRLDGGNGNAIFAGDVSVEDNLYLTDAGTVRGKIQLNSSDRDDLDIKAVSLGSNMKFFTADAERMRIDSTGIIHFSKTNNTSHIVATINHASNNFLYVSGGTGGASFGDDGQSTRMLAFDNDYLRFDTAGSEKMRIDSSGNVGIGTTSTTGARLVVASGGTDPQILVKNTAGNNAQILFEDNDGGTQNASIKFDQASQNTLTIETGYQSTNNTNRIYIAPAGNVALTAMGGSGGSAQSKVGIGTTTPTSRLQVSGDTYVTAQFGQGVAIANKVANYGAEFRTSGASAQLFFGRSGNNIGSGGIGADASYVLRVWKTDFSQPFVIEQGGNVGIGVTNPVGPLDIFGSAVQNGSTPGIRLSSSNTQQTVFAIGNTGTRQYELAVGGTTSSVPGAFYIYDNNVADFRITLATSGTLKLNAYDGTNKTGTPTYLLGTDASGNIVKTNTVPGSAAGPYLPLAGGTMTGTLKLNDNVVARFGTGNDLTIYHTGTTTLFDNNVGDVVFRQFADDKDIIFQSDNGSGGVENYIQIDGSEGRTTFNKNIRLNDNVKAQFGGSGDFNIFHNGLNSYLENDTGDLYIRNNFQDRDIIFQSDNGGGGIATYIQIDGSTGAVQLNHYGSKKFETKSYGVEITGQLVSTDNIQVGNNLILGDNKKAFFGGSNDLQIYHNGSNSYINDTGTGDLYIQASDNMYFQTYGSGKRWITLTENAAVDLFYNDIHKLSTGIVGTGTATTAGGTLIDGWKTTTQANAINDTTIATTAYVNNKIGLIPAGLVFQGTWNAATNTPTLTSGSGTTGNFYIVSVAGSTNLDGITDWKVGDWAVFIEQGASDQWEKIDNSSVLDGFGTGQSVTKWDGSGTSNTLTNGPITFSGNNSTFAGTIGLPNGGDIFWDGGYSAGKPVIAGNSTVINMYPAGNVSGAQFSLSATAATFAGSVKIDSTAGYKLNVEDNASFLFYGATNATTGSVFRLRSNNKAVTIVDINASGNATFAGGITVVGNDAQFNHNIILEGGIFHKDDTNTSFGFPADDNIAFTTSGTERMRVNSSGNVGIGTTNPQTELHVKGNNGWGEVRVEGQTFASGHGSSLEFYSEGTALADIYASTDKNLHFRTNGTTERMRIDSSGVVTMTRNTATAASLSDITQLKIENTSTSFGGSAAGIQLDAGNGDTTGFILSRADGNDNTFEGVIIGTVTDNPIIFSTNTGNAVISNEKMRIDSSGNVGIGTGSPSQKLHVHSTSGDALVRVSGDNILNSGGEIKGFNNGFAFNVAPSGGGTYVERMRINGSGNVGIGTTSPSAGSRLEVIGKGDQLGSTGFYVNSSFKDDANVGVFICHDDTVNTTGAIAGINQLSFITYGSSWQERMKITGGGNVGIGTTSPTQLLHVNSTTSNPTGIGLQNSQRYYSVRSNNYSLVFTDETVGTERMRINSSGNVGIGTTNPGTKLQISGANSSTSATALFSIQKNEEGYGLFSGILGSGTSWLQSSTKTESTYYSLALQPNGGNVGIGTTGVFTNNHILNLSGTGIAIKNDTNGSSNNWSQIKNTATGSGANLVFLTATGTNIMDDFGNFGIGVTNPEKKLHVQTTTSDSTPQVLVQNDGTGDASMLLSVSGQSYVFGIDYDDSKKFKIASSSNLGTTDRVTLLSTGQVGIGTITPSYQLEVASAGDGLLSLKGATKPVMRFMVGTSTIGTIQAQTNTSLNVSAYGTSSLNLQTAGTTPRLTILTGGNVGIGTDNPGAKLDIRTDSGVVIKGETGSTNAKLKFLPASGGRQYNFENDSSSFQIVDVSAGSTRMYFHYNGNLGIGTTSPDSLLEIEGATNSSTSNLLRLSRASQGSTPEKVAGFYSGTSGEKGYITVNNFGTAYNTSSDYRLKENIKPIDNSVERLMSLKPCNFNFISEDENKVVMDGFIAHEAKEVVPEAVTGLKDAVDEKGNPAYQGIDQSKLVPLLTAALQEALQRIEILEQKINN